MIELKNIYKSYGEPPKQVLDNISLSFDDGFTCLMGQSGIGKTTLVYIISGLVKADSGHIIGLEGKKLSFVFQEDRLLDGETSIDNVLFVCKSAKKNYRKAQTLLEQAGLADSMYKKASELSGGMRRRVCICRALIADYDLLILDEPFKGLDSGIKPSVINMLKEHTKGKTVICITHDLKEAEQLGGNIIKL